MNRAWTLFLGSVLAACAADAAPGPDDFDLFAHGAKGDLWEMARPLTPGEPITGHVDRRAFELFSFDGAEGDVIEVEVTRTSGSWDPRTAFYSAGGYDVDHDEGSFRRKEAGNVKRVTSTRDGRYYLVVRANYYRGAGEFTVVARCVGGPCAGDFGPADDDLVYAGTCLERARDCAFSQLDTLDVADVAAATELFDGCLATESVFEYECASACAIDGAATELCTTIVESLPFYDGKSAGCRALVNDCLDECNEHEENSPYLEDDDFEFWQNSEPICWNDVNYHGSCDEFARGHEVCGGTEYAVEETFSDCMAYCGATSGAWLGDIDDSCGPGCQDVCIEVRERCDADCAAETDPAACYGACVSNDPRAAEDDDWGCDFIR